MTTAHFRSPIARYSRPKRSKLIKKKRKPKKGDNPAYRAFVREFACVACFGCLLSDEGGVFFSKRQQSPTECAHVGARGLSQKCPDSQSLPLCAIEHHQVGPESHHVLGKRFWGFHGLDRAELIKQMQELFQESQGLNGGSVQGSKGVVRVQKSESAS